MSNRSARRGNAPYVTPLNSLGTPVSRPSQVRILPFQIIKPNLLNQKIEFNWLAFMDTFRTFFLISNVSVLLHHLANPATLP